MNPLVCFIGIDGSGKTTLCKMLVNELRSRGIHSRYVYGRFLPKMMAPIFKIISTLALGREKSPNHHNTRLANRRQLLSNPIISKIFIVGVLFDQILQMLLKIHLPSVFRTEVIVCDRYFHDTVLIDIAIPCGFNYTSIVHFVQRYLPLFPKINTMFFVVVPPEIAFQRKKDITSLPALEQLSDIYSYTSKYFGAMAIDGTMNLSELKAVILNKLDMSEISLNARI